MKLHSVTILQRTPKYELADYFYSEILSLPARKELGGGAIRWFERPAYLTIVPIPYGDDPELAGGFTGIQCNVVPRDGVNAYAERMLETGRKLPEPRVIEDVAVLSVPDSSENTIMLLGRDEAPDEPLIDDAIGSVSVFVEEIERAKRFYVDVLELPVRAEPHEGLIVLGEEGTALMLYQVPKDHPSTPIGRRTGIALSDPDLLSTLGRIEASEGRVDDRVAAAQEGEEGDGGDEPRAAMVSDPDGNQVTLLCERQLNGG